MTNMDLVMEPIFTKMIPCLGVKILKMIPCSEARPRTEKICVPRPRRGVIISKAEHVRLNFVFLNMSVSKTCLRWTANFTRGHT